MIEITVSVQDVRKEHPEWTAEQCIEEMKKRFAASLASELKKLIQDK